MKDNYVAVVIPVYKEHLNELENISLEQAVHILNGYDIYFIMPESIHINNQYGIQERKLCDSYFESINSYNRLMLMPEFYEHFIDYEYILIYQLDAFVFTDNLKYFCSLGYDYIGAPWLDGSFYYRDSGHMIWYVGNGGLSLRRVDSCIRILRQNQDLLVNNRLPEDLFFSVLEGNDFHVAPLNTALEFSFEMNVKECYERNGNRLPFGCHAWHRFDLTFWRPWIEAYGYRIPKEMCREGREDTGYLVKFRRKEISLFWLNQYKKEDLKAQLLQLFGDIEGAYAVWGAGYWGQIVCRMLEDAGLPIETFIDRQETLEKCRILGYGVVTPETLKDKTSKYKVIVAAVNGWEEAEIFLKNMDYCYKKDYIFLKDIDLLYQNILI